MIGLVYKDLMVMKKTLVIYAFISLVYFYMEINRGRPGMMSAMMLITSTMVPISAIAYDERSKWDRIVNTTPLSRTEVVMAKYLLAVLLTAVSAVVIFVMYVLTGSLTIADSIARVAAMILMSMLYQAFLFPTIIKFGSEKGRMIMMFIFFAPVIRIFALEKTGIINLSAVSDLMERNTAVVPFIVAGAVAAIYVVSIVISVRIYSGKDL